jgi:2-hydroxycyclohexanecarboxyl-CoA dehydrogenase
VRLKGKVAVVTGAGRGIGAAIAAGLAAEGASLAVCDRDAAAARHTAGALDRDHAVRAIGIDVDISDPESVTSAVTAVTGELGPVDVLVNNAGIDVVGRFVDGSVDSWDRIIAVNLRGTILMTRAVLDSMIGQGEGRIIHIASDAGRVGSSGEVVYSATKGGVIAFGKALAREVARHRITVNTVCPGPTDTALLEQVASHDPRIIEATVRAIPLRRVARPEEIASMVTFLATDAAAYLTGQTVSVSGGLTMV